MYKLLFRSVIRGRPFTGAILTSLPILGYLYVLAFNELGIKSHEGTLSGNLDGTVMRLGAQSTNPQL